jgi:antitoxin component of MazEF toxin-antitoxin module
MKVQVGKWGNSWAIQIPRSIAAALVPSGERVLEVRTKENKLFATPMSTMQPTLAEMLDSLEGENSEDYVKFGPLTDQF